MENNNLSIIFTNIFILYYINMNLRYFTRIKFYKLNIQLIIYELFKIIS